MDIREIDYVLAICDSGSMKQAAEELFITQPALSKYIQSLEMRLGYTLFDRQKKNRLVLTPAGEIYLRHARRIAEERDAMVREIEEHMNPDNAINIGLGLNIHERHIDEIVQEFKLRYPECEISLRTQRMNQNLTDLQNLALDFSESPIPGDDRFDFYPVYDERMMLALPNDHPLLSQVRYYPGTDLPWIDIHLFQNEDFVLQDRSCWVRTMIDAFLEQNAFSPRIFASTNSTSAALHLVENGICLGFCTNGLSAGNSNMQFVNVGDPLFSYESGLIFRRGDPIRPQVRYFAQLFGRYNAKANYLQDERWRMLDASAPGI